MSRWFVCTMDDGVLSEHRTKQEAVQAIPDEWAKARRLREGEYEYTTDGDGRGMCETYYVMTWRGARRNGWETEDKVVVKDRHGQEVKRGDTVLLKDWFPPDIPHQLVGTTAYVNEITRRGKLVVTATYDAYGTRRVWPQHVAVWAQ